MRGYAYSSETGRISSMFIRNPAEWKRESIANVLDDSLPYYRYVIRDDTPAGGGLVVWDSDKVLGITPSERGDKSVAQIGSEFSAALSEARNRPVWPDDVPFGPSHVSDAVDERLRHEAQEAVCAVHWHREMETARLLARFVRETHEARSGLDREDDAAAYHSLAYVAARAKTEAVMLGWPIDANGDLLPDCKDEA